MADQTKRNRHVGAPWIACLAGLMCAGSASAKEAHFEKVKGELIELYIRCTTCHVSKTGSALTRYGKRIADMDNNEPLRDRVRRMERRVSDELAQTMPDIEQDRVDIDGDGALNWVEILCETDPSDASSVPAEPAPTGADPTRRSRIENVVNCMLCHESIKTGVGKKEAPHNPFGALLAKLGETRKPSGRTTPNRRPTSAQEPEPPDILERFRKIRYQDTDKDKARNFDELATFHSPADKTDTPTPEEIKAIKARVLANRRLQNGYGRVHRK